MNKGNKIIHTGKKLVPHPSWNGHLKKERYISPLPTGSNSIKKKKRCEGVLCADEVSTKKAQIPQSDDYCEACFNHELKMSLSWKR